MPCKTFNIYNYHDYALSSFNLQYFCTGTSFNQIQLEPVTKKMKEELLNDVIKDLQRVEGAVQDISEELAVLRTNMEAISSTSDKITGRLQVTEEKVITLSEKTTYIEKGLAESNESTRQLRTKVRDEADASHQDRDRLKLTDQKVTGLCEKTKDIEEKITEVAETTKQTAEKVDEVTTATKRLGERVDEACLTTEDIRQQIIIGKKLKVTILYAIVIILFHETHITTFIHVSEQVT